MGLFPQVSPVLNELDRQGSAQFGEKWDRAVFDAILGLNASYGGRNLLDRNRKLIDYGALATQAAYVFMYVAGHADILGQVFAKAQEADALSCLGQEELRVTSFGGGPGSDLLALVHVIRSLPAKIRPKRIRYRVLDKQPNWHEILQIVAKRQRGTMELEVSFEQVDVTVPDQWEHVTCENDDILLMNFFVSEVCKLREAASVRKCLKRVLKTMKSDSVVIFNDNNFPSCYEYFDERCAAAGGFLRLVVESGRLDAEPNFDEFFKECMVRFERTPKLTSNAAFRVLRRQ